MKLSFVIADFNEANTIVTSPELGVVRPVKTPFLTEIVTEQAKDDLCRRETGPAGTPS